MSNDEHFTRELKARLIDGEPYLPGKVICELFREMAVGYRGVGNLEGAEAVSRIAEAFELGFIEAATKHSERGVA